ncbi:hypothetical protein LTS15_008662 [Exophiala xenobiotica]|nr:hypothetical protein LTS15_008662 [Exophiala xenobiotica]
MKDVVESSSLSSTSDKAVARTRKTHKKSRSGCRNCKLRRVKCDEKRPMCGKCADFDVTCNYNTSIPDLQPCSGAVDGISADPMLQKSPFSANDHVLNMINLYLDADVSTPSESFKALGSREVDRLNRFQSRTILTVGNKGTARYFRKEMMHLACNHRFLMHLVQAMTAQHDRFLTGKAISGQSEDENYHMSQGIKGVQTRLSRPIRPEDRDALFISASLLGVMTFFAMEAKSIEHVWPLADGDLSWVNLSDGKKTIWRATNPLRRDSVWRPMAEMYEHDFMSSEKGPGCVLSVFDHLCSERDGSIAALANPYHKSAQYLISLLGLELTDSTWIRFLAFICQVDPPWKELLAAKDPWALLMLAYWFMKICRGAWWASTRAIVQGQAICVYLERYHADDALLQMAIPLPKQEFEAAQSEGLGGLDHSICGSRHIS